LPFLGESPRMYVRNAATVGSICELSVGEPTQTYLQSRKTSMQSEVWLVLRSMSWHGIFLARNASTMAWAILSVEFHMES